MIVENVNGVKILYAESNKKITNLKREFFSDFIYLCKSDSIEKYEEVGREIWASFIDDNKTDFDILSKRIDFGEEQIVNLEEVALDTDFRLLKIELKFEDEAEPESTIQTFSMVNLYTKSKGGVAVFTLLKNRIVRKTYTSKEDMQEMLDTYYFAKRIVTEQYAELTTLLEEQE